MIIQKDKIEKQFDKFIIGTAESIPSPKIKNFIDYYNKNYNKRLTALPPKILTEFHDNTAKWNIGDNKLYVSIKVDGQAAFLVYDSEAEGDKAYFCNASLHRVYLGLEAANEAEKYFEQHKIQKAIIAGELFTGQISEENQNIDFSARSHIYEFVEAINNPEGYKKIGFRAFDIITIDEQDLLNQKYSIRNERLTEIFPSSGRVAHVNNLLMKKEQIAGYYDQIVNEGGAEGIVVRNAENNRSYKIKPIHSLDVVIIGVVSGKPGSKIRKDQLGTSLVALRYRNGDYQVLGRVGGGLSDEDRTNLWNQMNFVESDYIGVTSDGRAFRMVEPHCVAVIDYLDIYTHSSDGTPKMQPRLCYNAQSKKWKFLRSMPFVSLISPRFRKEHPLHEDKQPLEGEPQIIDVRVDQVRKFVTLPLSTTVESTELPKSEIKARMVFKNKEKVKKFVLWQTNKHEHDPNYPKYVVFFTDYSPTRRDPLQRSVRTTNDSEKPYQLLGDWIVEEMLNSKQTGLKRGWQKYQTKYEDTHIFKITFPHGFQQRSRSEVIEAKYKKVEKQFKKVKTFLDKLSIKIHLNLPSPCNGLQHAIDLLQNRDIIGFLNIISDFNETEWLALIEEIPDESDQKTVRKIIELLKQFTKESIQANLRENMKVD